MKFLILLGVIALAAATPQPRKLFHEHFDDFLNVIREEAAHDIEHLFEQYLEFEEFKATLGYLATQNFKDIVYELESLPEFKAVVDFLENDNIDMHFFIDRFNEMIEHVYKMKRTNNKLRHELSGTDFSSFIKDIISEFPSDKLAALFEEKKAENDEFRTAVENLNSEEWHSIFGALWESETFLAEVKALDENGINVHVLLQEILAVFGQN